MCAAAQHRRVLAPAFTQRECEPAPTSIQHECEPTSTSSQRERKPAPTSTWHGRTLAHAATWHGRASALATWRAFALVLALTLAATCSLTSCAASQENASESSSGISNENSSSENNSTSENASEGKNPAKDADSEGNATSPNGANETNTTTPANDARFDASAATQLMIFCYPALGSDGQRTTNDPDLIAHAVELVTSAQFTTPCDKAAWQEKTAGTSGGYYVSLSLLGADGNTLIHIMHNPSLEQLGVAATSVYVHNEDGTMLLISDDQEPLVSFLDECVALAKSETGTSKTPGFDNPDNTWHFV